MLPFILFLAFFNEAFIEYFVSSESKAQPYLKYIALSLGILVACIFQVNILDLLSIEGLPEFEGVALWALYVMTGVVISRGSNFVNDIIGLAYTKKKEAKAVLASLE